MISFLLPIAALLAWQDPPPAPQQPPLFAKTPFEQARQQSQTIGRPILLYFSEASSPQCKSYAEFTWSDPKVRTWINQRTIPIEMDIATQAELARRYHVRTAPALIVVLPDGTSSREIVGFRGPDLLIRLLEARLVDPVTAARRTLEASGNSTAARLEYAQVLADEARYPESMEQYLQCMDGPAMGSSGDIGERLMAVEAFSRLILVHPPARDALTERRDRLRETVAIGGATAQETVLFAFMNVQLGAVEDTLSLYHSLKRSSPTAMVTRMLRDSLAESLIATRRYAEALTIIDPLKHFEFALEQQLADERRPGPDSAPDRAARFRSFLRDQFVERTIRYYELLLGAGRDDDARGVADRLIGLHPTSKTYHLLAAASLRTGRAPTIALGQAQMAIDLSEGTPSYDLLVTLVRCLKAVGRDDEASALVRTYADRIADVEQSEAFRALALPKVDE